MLSYLGACDILIYMVKVESYMLEFVTLVITYSFFPLQLFIL
jgi:hypothetical protein